MRKRIKRPKTFLLITAIVVGLITGLLIIPRISDLRRDRTQLSTPPLNQESAAPTTAELLDEKNWIIYKDDEYSFSFYFPKGLETNVFSEQEQEIDLFTGINFGRVKMPNRTLYQDDFAQLGYVIYVRIDRVTPLKTIMADTEVYKNNEGYTKQQFKINGLDAYKYDKVGSGGNETRVLFERNKHVYVFTFAKYVPEGELVDEGNQIFNRMINSITF